MLKRPRRNRKSVAIRNMVAETHLGPEHLVAPLFLKEGTKVKEPIGSLPGLYRMSLDMMIEEIQHLIHIGIGTVALFPVIEDSLKTSDAKEAVNPKGLVPRTIRELKNQFPDLVIVTDVALDPYNSDGHDGLVRDGVILNDETNQVLSQMALVHAKAGADIVAPSDMMDGRVQVIRNTLDWGGYRDVSILSYCAKYASSFYGPFRDALDSAPRFGDKKTYQMDYRNSVEAEREAELDVAEGADFLMVKPALCYLDVIYRLKQRTNLPIVAYNVSGEYAMVKAAAERGMVNGTQVMVEMLYSMKRAGADIIFTYFAREMAEYLRQISRSVSSSPE
jgi:porphobilinogen synthase